MPSQQYSVSHGSKKFNVTVESKEPTLRDLSYAVSNAIGVPINKQKLICRGKTLSDMGATLDQLHVSAKSKIMLIGKKVDGEEEKHIKYFQSLQKDAEQIWLKYEELNNDICGLEQGFLDLAKSKEATTKLKKRLASLSEGFMKIIEAIDNVELDSSYLDARAKRKSLVTQINKYLNETDKSEEHLKNIESRLWFIEFKISGLSSQSYCLSCQSSGLSCQIPGFSSQSSGLSSQSFGLLSLSSGLSSQSSGLSSQIPGLSSQIPGLSSQIPGLSNQIPGLSNQIPGLSSQSSGLSCQIPGLSSQILVYQVKALVYQVKALVYQVKSLVYQIKFLVYQVKAPVYRVKAQIFGV